MEMCQIHSCEMEIVCTFLSAMISPNFWFLFIVLLYTSCCVSTAICSEIGFVVKMTLFIIIYAVMYHTITSHCKALRALIVKNTRQNTMSFLYRLYFF